MKLLQWSIASWITNTQWHCCHCCLPNPSSALSLISSPLPPSSHQHQTVYLLILRNSPPNENPAHQLAPKSEAPRSFQWTNPIWWARNTATKSTQNPIKIICIAKEVNANWALKSKEHLLRQKNETFSYQPKNKEKEDTATKSSTQNPTRILSYLAKTNATGQTKVYNRTQNGFKPNIQNPSLKPKTQNPIRILSYLCQIKCNWEYKSI